MRTGIILAVGGGLALLTACGTMGNKPYEPPAAKWKAPYHLEFDTKPAKPNPAGIALPTISYTSDTKVLEKRASLVVRFDSSAVKQEQTVRDQMIMPSVDIPEAGAALPASYMDSADKGLAKLLGDAGMNGKVKVSVVLVRSSIKPDAGEGEIDAKRLSEWVSTEVEFKNPHPKRQAATH